MTFTSKAVGNWNATGQTTWNEVGAPASGDTASISHAVTVTADQDSVRAAKVTALLIKRCRTVLTERCRYITK